MTKTNTPSPIEGQTTIEKWVEGKTPEIRANYQAGSDSVRLTILEEDFPLMLKEFSTDLLTYLGLEGVADPKSLIDKVNESAAILPLMSGMIEFLNNVKNEGKSFTSRIAMMEEENDAFDIVLWACPADVAGNPIQRIMDLGKERNQLQSQVESLQARVKELTEENLRLIEQQLDVHWEVEADAAGLTKEQQADIQEMCDKTIAASNAHDAEFKRLQERVKELEGDNNPIGGGEG